MTPASAIPVLSTQRLTLRAIGLDDFDAFATLHASPHAALMWAIAARDEAWRVFLALAGEWIVRGFGMWAMADRATGRFLGHCGFLQPQDAPEPELGWALTADAEGLGLAAEGARAARAWGRSRGIPTPVSHIDARNGRSIRLAERLGARLEGRTAYGPDAVALHYRHPAGDAA
jgi:ribosomal-protein-alanine N-acetyltransferase